MQYKGYYVKITPDQSLIREAENGTEILCEGFRIEVFTDGSEKEKLDEFSAAVNYELLENSMREAEQLDVYKRQDIYHGSVTSIVSSLKLASQYFTGSHNAQLFSFMTDSFVIRTRSEFSPQGSIHTWELPDFILRLLFSLYILINSISFQFFILFYTITVYFSI